MDRYFLHFLFLITMVFFSVVGFSQSNTDFASLNYSMLPKSEFKNGVGEAQLNHFDINLVTPTIKLTTKTKINSIVYYRFSLYDYSFPSETIVLPEELHEIKYSLLTRHTFNSMWELLLLPRISIRSDFKADLNLNDLFPAVSAIVMKTSQKNPDFKYGLGLNYNNDLSKNSVIPILAFAYTNTKLRFNAYLPNNATLTFIAGKKIEYGCGFMADPVIIHNNNIESVDYLRTLNVPVYSSFSYNLTSNVWLSCRAGWMLSRNFDLYNGDFKAPSSDLENQLKSSAYVQMGVSLRTKQ